MQPFYLFFIPSLASIPQHLHHISHHSSSFAHQSSIITLISPINQYVPTMENEIPVSDQRDCRLLLRKQNDGCTRSKQRTMPVKLYATDPSTGGTLRDASSFQISWKIPPDPPWDPPAAGLLYGFLYPKGYSSNLIALDPGIRITPIV